MKPARGPYGSSNVENCLFVRSLTHSLSCPNFKRCFTEVLGPRGTVENDPEGAAGTHHQTHGTSVRRRLPSTHDDDATTDGHARCKPTAGGNNQSRAFKVD